MYNIREGHEIYDLTRYLELAIQKRAREINFNTDQAHTGEILHSSYQDLEAACSAYIAEHDFEPFAEHDWPEPRLNLPLQQELPHGR
jgi:hypothetical protein